jgi:AcrR family transcriptional regulator
MRTRRRAILDTSLALFLDHGMAATTIEEIRAHCDASVGSIYHHFGSKENIAATLHLDALESYQSFALAAVQPHDDARGGIEAGVVAHVAWVVEHHDQARFLLLTREPLLTPLLGGGLRELNTSFFSAILGWIEPHVRRGEVRELPFDLLYALWLGPAQELARLWLAGRHRDSLTASAPVLAAAAWRSLTTDGDT